MDRKWIRTPLDPDITYSDDPLRMMRAVRFASQLGFRIEEGSLEAIRRNAKRLEIISAERIHTELNKIVAFTQTFSRVQADVQDQTLASILPRNGGASRR